MPLASHGRRAEINATPLIDVVLVLLIIFMVITPMLSAGHAVDLPHAGAAGPPAEAPLRLVIEADAVLLLEGQPVALPELGETLAARLAGRQSRDLVVACHAGIAYQRVVDVIDVARRAGVARIGIPQALGRCRSSGEPKD